MEGESVPRARRRGPLRFSRRRRVCEVLTEHTAKPPPAKGGWCFCGNPPSHGAPPQGDAALCRGVATAAEHTRRGVAARGRRIRRRVNQKPRRCWGHGRHGVADGERVNRRGFLRGCRRVAMGCEPIDKAAPPTRRLLAACVGGSIAAAVDSLMGEHTDEVCAAFSAQAERQADNEREAVPSTAQGIRPRIVRVMPSPARYLCPRV